MMQIQAGVGSRWWWGQGGGRGWRLCSSQRYSQKEEKHTVPKLPAAINHPMSQEQVCMSEFWGHGR